MAPNNPRQMMFITEDFLIYFYVNAKGEIIKLLKENCLAKHHTIYKNNEGEPSN